MEPKVGPTYGGTSATDGQHLILDVKVPAGRDMADLVDELKRFAGVVDTGFFPFEATEAIVATPAGPKRMRRGETNRSGFKHPS